MATKVVFITSGTTYTVPLDFASIVSVEVIGGGGGSKRLTAAGGSGAGAYSASTSVTGLVAGGTAYVSIGAGGTAGGTPTNGGDTWFNAASNAAPTLASQGALAKGGTAATTTTGGAGGASASAIMPDMSDAASGLAGSAKDYINQKRERTLMNSQVDLQELQGKAAKAAASQSLASARKAETEAKALEAEMPAIESGARLSTKRNQIDEKAVMYDAVANRAAQVLGAAGSATSLGRFLRRAPKPQPSGEPGKIVPAMPKKTSPTANAKDLDYTKEGRLFNKRTGEIYD